MKTPLALLSAIVISAAAAGLIATHLQSARNEALLAERTAAWQAERSALEAALAEAKARPRTVNASPGPAPIVAEAALRPTPVQIIAKLRGLRAVPGITVSRTLRLTVYWLEELATAGPAALPAIREFLGRSEDMDLDTSWLGQNRGGVRGRLPQEFALPPSLRFGMFDVLRQVGGPGAEKVLAEAMVATGRGAELAYLTGILQELAPDQYREQALVSARELLASSVAFTSSSPLDRDHRDYLFGVLTLFGDASYAVAAQGQLIQGDGQLDRSALRYLQQALGAQAVPIAAQAYQDPRLTDPAVKEPLARLALNFVGADAQANQFYQQAINDPALPKDARRNLIEDLNQDGFADRKNLTANDLPLIQRRIALIEQSAPNAMDPINAKAFAEAYKDLQNMQGRILNPAPNPPGGKKKGP